MKTTKCEICGRPDASRHEGYDFPICPRCAVPAPDGPAIGNPSIGSEGALSWEFRPPSRVGVEGCDLEIEIGGVTQYQQRPPVHVKGSAYRSASVKTVPREITEAEAARRLARMAAARTEAQGDALRLKSQGMTYAQIADALGITIVAVRDRLRRARAAIKAAK